MSNGDTNINIIENLLQHFRFKQLLPDEVKEFIIKYERNALISTLQRIGEYNYIYGLVIRIFYISYKLRIPFSIKTSKIILSIILILLTGSVSAGILFSSALIKDTELHLPDISINQLPNNYEAEPANTNPGINILSDSDTIAEQTIENDAISNKKYVKYRLGVNLFSANNIDEELSGIATDNIREELSRILGQNKVLDLRRNQKDISYNRIVSGSISGLGKKIIIAVKVSDVENSKLLFGVTDIIESVNELPDRCSDIAKLIIEDMESK